MASHNLKKNALLNGIKTISSIIFPLITFPYITRVLLPDNVGKVNFGLSIVSYFSLIATLGMSTYAVRECARVKSDKNNLSKTASQLFSINLCTTVIAYVLLAITLLLFRELDNYRTLIIIQSTSILFTAIGADWLNSAMEDFGYITLRTIAFQAVSLILMFLFVREQDDYIIYALITVVSSSGANIANIWYRRRYCNVKFTSDMEVKRHGGPILAFFAMVLSTTIFANADTTMLGLMVGDHEVGLYSSAHKIVHVVSQLVQSIIFVLIPRLSIYFSNNDFENANKLLRKLLNFNISLGLPCVTGLIMVASDAIVVFAGEEYIGAASVLRIMILSFAFSLVGGSFLGNGILLPMGEEKYYMKVCLITAACNVILNYIFIPLFQADAAAATSAFNGFLIFILLLLRVDKRIKIKNIGKVFFSPVVGCLFIVLICFALQGVSNLYVRLILSVGLSVMAYGIVLLLLKNEIVTEVIEMMKKKLKK
ncbi:MAG: oligosaccharide flippase family protein [Oscillospiraceae bacterium]|nr:oligosaccharide flippase family protein [Oscillospiraceae bacterium]